MPTSSELLMPRLSDRTRGRTQRTLLRPGRAFRILLLMAVVACSAFIPQPAAAQAPPSVQPAQDEHPYCISHIWAAGSQLGSAEALARRDSQSETAGMLEYMHSAGVHIQRANELCAQHPAPWPAWSNWREIQDQLTDMADKFQAGELSRAQLAIAITALHQSLALQLAFRVRDARAERESTCEEIYVRLANALGFAQTTTQISQRLTPDAAVRLRKSSSLIYQAGEMPETCRDFKGLIPAISEALNSTNDSSVIGRVDDIWHAGEVAAGPKVE